MTYIKAVQSSASLSATPQNMDGPSAYTQIASITATKNGLAQVSAVVRVNEGSGSSNAWAQLRILVGGSVVATGNQSGVNANSNDSDVAVQYQGSVQSGQAITLEIRGDDIVDTVSGTMMVTIGPG